MPRLRPPGYDPLEGWRFLHQFHYDILHPHIPFVTPPDLEDRSVEKVSHAHFTPEVMGKVLADHFNLQGHVYDPRADLAPLTPLDLWERQMAFHRVLEVLIGAKKVGDRHYRHLPDSDGWSCLYCPNVVAWHYHYTADGVARVTLGDLPCTTPHMDSYTIQIATPSGRVALGNNLLPPDQVPEWGSFRPKGNTIWQIYRADVEGNAKNDLAKIPTQGGECFVYQIEGGYELRPRPLEGVSALGRVWASHPRSVSIADVSKVPASPEAGTPELVLPVGSDRIEVEVAHIPLLDWVCRIRSVGSP